MERENVIILIAMLLVAGVGVFAMFSGGSANAMVPVGPDYRASPLVRPLNLRIGQVDLFCNKPCTRMRDCGGNCGVCSAYSGKCVTQKQEERMRAFAEEQLREYQQCVRACRNEYEECNRNRAAGEGPARCYGLLSDCEDRCRIDIYG
jgi:hypothetical protein